MLVTDLFLKFLKGKKVKGVSQKFSNLQIKKSSAMSKYIWWMIMQTTDKYREEDKINSLAQAGNLLNA